jgi:hypothetical protein
MKKITLLAFILATFLTNAQEVLNENFDGSSSIPAGWVSNDIAGAGDTWTIGSGAAHPNYAQGENTYLTSIADFSGNYAYFNSDADSNNNLAEDVALESPVFDCSNLTTVILSYNDWFLPDYGGSATVETSTDNGVNWTVAYTYTEVEYGARLLDVSSYLAGQSTAQIRFRWIGSWSLSMFIDNVVVQQPTGSAPAACTTPNPLNDAVDVVINQYTIPSSGTTYKWVEVGFAAGTGGDPATSYDVTYSLNPDLSDPVLVATDYDGTVAENGSLWGTTAAEGWQKNTKYYWKVTANNIAGSTDSPIWNFTTGANDPLGLNDVTIETFKAYPNPVTDIVTIEGNAPIDSVEIVNQLGQNVLDIDVNSTFNNQINLSKLNTGIYFVKVKSASKIQTLQILKQ